MNQLVYYQNFSNKCGGLSEWNPNIKSILVYWHKHYIWKFTSQKQQQKMKQIFTFSEITSCTFFSEKNRHLCFVFYKKTQYKLPYNKMGINRLCPRVLCTDFLFSDFEASNYFKRGLDIIWVCFPEKNVYLFLAELFPEKTLL